VLEEASTLLRWVCSRRWPAPWAGDRRWRDRGRCAPPPLPSAWRAGRDCRPARGANASSSVSGCVRGFWSANTASMSEPGLRGALFVGDRLGHDGAAGRKQREPAPQNRPAHGGQPQPRTARPRPSNRRLHCVPNRYEPTNPTPPRRTYYFCRTLYFSRRRCPPTTRIEFSQHLKASAVRNSQTIGLRPDKQVNPNPFELCVV